MNKNKDEFNGVPIVIKAEDKEIGRIQTFVETKERIERCQKK